jgi:hypothetical protein
MISNEYNKVFFRFKIIAQYHLTFIQKKIPARQTYLTGRIFYLVLTSFARADQVVTSSSIPLLLFPAADPYPQLPFHTHYAVKYRVLFVHFSS